MHCRGFVNIMAGFHHHSIMHDFDVCLLFLTVKLDLNTCTHDMMMWIIYAILFLYLFTHFFESCHRQLAVCIPYYVCPATWSKSPLSENSFIHQTGPRCIRNSEGLETHRSVDAWLTFQPCLDQWPEVVRWNRVSSKISIYSHDITLHTKNKFR